MSYPRSSALNATLYGVTFFNNEKRCWCSWIFVCAAWRVGLWVCPHKTMTGGGEWRTQEKYFRTGLSIDEIVKLPTDYRLSTTLVKYLAVFFAENDKLILKFIWGHKRAKTITEKNKGGRIHNCWFQNLLQGYNNQDSTDNGSIIRTDI